MEGAKYDALIIGAGHNGMTLGCYLAKAGLKVCVMERRLEAGGGLSTEEISVPGFAHNLHSYFHDTINIMPAYQDLELERFNARYYRPPVQAGTILPDGRSLCLYDSDNLDKTCASIARFSAHDAKKWREVVENYSEFCSTVIVPALYSPPAPPSEQIVIMEGSAEGMEWLRLMRMSPLEVVNEWFENDVVKALVLHHLPFPRGILPDYAGIGTVVPLVVSQVEHSQMALGGSHMTAHALWRALLRAGAETTSLTHVERILIEDGKAVGVRTAEGKNYLAPIVVSTVDVKQTFLKMVGEENLEPGFVDKVKGFRLDEFSVFCVHLALKEAPRFKAQAGFEDINRAFRLNIGFDAPEDYTELVSQVRLGKLPEKLAFIASVPTWFDPSQAPEGYHTMFLWQLAPYRLKGATWEEVNDEYAARCVAKLREYAPNVTPDNIMGMATQTPVDISNRIINMAEGGVFMGRMNFAQLEHFRPLAELAQFRTPIKGLYLAGACMHPGGGIIAGPGVIAADVILDDLKRPKWWEAQ
ncbi:MAG: NAD(P)/FAD-dependent oxidoreductase [Betaproteobacteria bacterium]|nr:NAD(P)/FAD-dependent oxidoreductase [Betaproteobacteria bacterium]